jgi:hypothetical protein
MKTSKTSSKSEKTSKDVGFEKRKKVIIGNSAPSEEEIREKAAEIYNKRLLIGVNGSDIDDWLEAEALLSETGK